MSIILPQRLSRTAPIGSLLKQPVAPTRSSDHSGDRDDAYLAMVRQCPCIKCGMDPCGEAAHVRQQSAAHGKRGSIGKKPADRFALPLCRGCHLHDQDSQHRIGEAMFWHMLGISPLLICDRLYPKASDLVAMRAVIFNAIAERDTVGQFRGIGRLGEQKR